MAQLQADAAKLESRTSSYHFGYQPLGPSLMCSSQAEGTTDVPLRRGPSKPRKSSYITPPHRRSAPAIIDYHGSSAALQKPTNVRAVPMIFPH